MLKGISPFISPELLAVLSRMGHGDEIVLADAHYPGESHNKRLLRADGIKVTDLLDGILPLFVLDEYAESPVFMMAAVKGDTLEPTIEKSYYKTIQKHYPDTPKIKQIQKPAFYEQAKKAFAIIMTGETAKYGNIILKKGVTPC